MCANTLEAMSGGNIPQESKTPTANRRPVEIVPDRGRNIFNLRELWYTRELTYLFIWRSIRVRYKQTVLGTMWTLIQPLAMMAIFMIVFKQIAGVPSGSLPYPIFALSGILLWNFLASVVTNASNSVIGSERIITHAYFPRFVLPMANLGSSLLDLLIAMTTLIAAVIYFGVAFELQLLLVPVVILITACLALGIGSALAAINVTYRDVRYIVPFVIQFWMFATPSIYMQTSPVEVATRQANARTQNRSALSGTELPVSGQVERSVATNRLKGFFLRLNPMNSLIVTFRAAFLGGGIPWLELTISTITSLIALCVGYTYFRYREFEFADIL